MRRVIALMLLGMVGVMARVHAADPPPMEEAGAPMIRVGDSASRVRQQLGAPDRVARQVLRTHYLEHWTYLQPQLLRVILLGVPGSEPTVRELSGAGAENPKKISTPQ